VGGGEWVDDPHVHCEVVLTVQDPTTPAEADWTVTSGTVATFLKSLRQGEDEVVQHYAAQTIDNIFSQDGRLCPCFAC
jgi:hypothetical protein